MDSMYANMCLVVGISYLKESWNEAWLIMKRIYPVIDMVRTGRNIKMIMQAKGLSVKEIQKFLLLETPQSIYHWFEGKSMPTLDNLYALSELFRIPVDMLLKGNRKYVFVPFTDPMHKRLFVYYESLRERAA